MSTKRTTITESVADVDADGDGVVHNVPMPGDRSEMVRTLVFGDKIFATDEDSEFGALVAEQKRRHAVSEGRIEKLAPSAKGDPMFVGEQRSEDPGQEDKRPFMSTGALVPPYDPGTMVHLFEHSNSLRQNVDAYATNIDSYGHMFKPTLNLESDDIVEQVRVAMVEDQILGGVEKPSKPTDKQVKAKIEEIRGAMAVERIKLEFFFRNAVMNESFVTLRMNSRQDYEVTGNSYWEVLRDREETLAQFILVPAHTVRILPLKSTLVPTEQIVQATPITFTKRIFRRRYRTYVQSFEGVKVFFKEFGDTRLVSAKSGNVHDNEDAMRKEEGSDAQPANELLHFAIHSSRSPYGVPRWIGALLSVIGSRQAEEVNFLYFDNKGVPPMVLLVTGGRVSANTVDRLKDYIASDIKGRKNFHSILVLEAESAAGSGPEHTGRMKIELKPLTSAQHNDALFQKYDKENINKVGQAFRMPPLLRGDSRDFNRATAQAVLKFTETQVFSPERNRFDDVINRRILIDLGICYHKYVSNSPKTTDPEDQAKVISTLAKVGGLVPRDIRQLAEEILNTDLKRIDEPWIDIPVVLATSGRIAELVEGPGDLFDPPSGTSTQTPLGGGQTGDDPAGKKPKEPTDAETKHMLVSDALAAGGKLQPAQGKLRRTPILDRATKLLNTRKMLAQAEEDALEYERTQAAAAMASDQDEQNAEPIEVIKVDQKTWESFGLIPDED